MTLHLNLCDQCTKLLLSPSAEWARTGPVQAHQHVCAHANEPLMSVSMPMSPLCLWPSALVPRPCAQCPSRCAHPPLSRTPLLFFMPATGALEPCAQRPSHRAHPPHGPGEAHLRVLAAVQEYYGERSLVLSSLSVISGQQQQKQL